MKLTYHAGPNIIWDRWLKTWAWDNNPTSLPPFSDPYGVFHQYLSPRPSISFYEVVSSVGSAKILMTGRTEGSTPILKSGELLVPPQVPQFRPPNRRRLIPPKILEGNYPSVPERSKFESPSRWNRRWQRYLDTIQAIDKWVALQNRVRRQKFDRKVAKRREMLARYVSVYQRRVAKYERRMAIYVFRLNKWKTRKPRFRNRTTGHKYDTINPYFRASWQGELDAAWYEIRNEYNPAARTRREYSVRHIEPGYDAHTPSVTLDGSSFDALPEALYQAFTQDLVALRADNRVRIQNKIAAQQFHVGKFFGEREQTFRMIAEKFRLIHDLRRKPLATAKAIIGFGSTSTKLNRAVNTIAGETLGVQFGVKPLVHDLLGLFELLESGPEKDGFLFFRQVRKKYIDQTVLLSGVPMRATGILTHRFWVKYSLDLGVSRLLQRLGLVNPLEIAWEVLPWSFWIDWIVPIGTYLGQISNKVGLSFIGATETVQFRGRLSPEVSGDAFHLSPPPWGGSNDPQYVLVPGGDGPFVFTSRVPIAEAELDLWLPDYFKIPTLSVNQWIDEIALIAQALSRRK